MSITREARHLSINDLGKTIQYEFGGSTTHGVLLELIGSASLIADERLCDSPDLISHGIGRTNIHGLIITNGDYLNINLYPETRITITGTDTPAGLNLHRSVIDQNE